MFKDIDRSRTASVQRTSPAGILLREGSETRSIPRAVAFIWGGEVLPAPSLPFGRWKPEVLSVA
jgi:hypothetical protein